MKLALWTYEGPTHVGAMRVANSMRDVHYVLHAPQGDTYADLLFTMIERQDCRPPVTYTTFQSRDLSADTAQMILDTIEGVLNRHGPKLLLVGESCTAELLQDQPGALAANKVSGVPVVPLELPAYSRKENWGASETLYQVVRSCLQGVEADPQPLTVNLIGPTSLSLRARDNIVEITRLLESLGVTVNVVAPLGAAPEDLRKIPQATANVCLYPEIGALTCRWLKKHYAQPTVSTVPMGIGATQEFVAEVREVLGLDVSAGGHHTRLPWYSRSVDSTYLTGKRVFIFGDATHAKAAARIARDELAFNVVGLGTYSREQARQLREVAADFGLHALISDDYLEVEAAIMELAPDLILGTQMERHIAKRLGIPCALISAPFHVQDCPARYSPLMGYEGANVIFDTWVHPLMMGLEEHLLHMFKDDFEFADGLTPSHLGGGVLAGAADGISAIGDRAQPADNGKVEWADEALLELKRIPFFVRKKAVRNTERFAKERGLDTIEVDTLYDAKAKYS